MPEQLAVIVNINNCTRCGASPHPALAHEFGQQEVSTDVLRSVLRELPEDIET